MANGVDSILWNMNKDNLLDMSKQGTPMPRTEKLTRTDEAEKCLRYYEDRKKKFCNIIVNFSTWYIHQFKSPVPPPLKRIPSPLSKTGLLSLNFELKKRLLTYQTFLDSRASKYVCQQIPFS